MRLQPPFAKLFTGACDEVAQTFSLILVARGPCRGEVAQTFSLILAARGPCRGEVAQTFSLILAARPDNSRR